MKKLVILFLSITTIAGGKSNAAQEDLGSIQAEWLSGDYLQVIGPLQNYLRTLRDDQANFSADFMMATSLTRLPQYHDLGCRYFQSMVRLYNFNQPQAVAGQTVVPQTVWNAECPPPPPAPGVHVAPLILPPKRSDVLTDVQAPAKLPKKDPRGPVTEEIARFSGVYELVSDGLRGGLFLKAGTGEFVDGEKQVHKLEVRIDGNHIVFYVMDESAGAKGGQKFDGYLMTDSGNSIAGLTWLKGQPSGFYALHRKLP